MNFDIKIEKSYNEWREKNSDITNETAFYAGYYSAYEAIITLLTAINVLINSK
ncbi:MAG: hypothetical protein K2H26_03710 [Ruminococcus sp.]|nr:hypothetical protein [Ruminococcus sp.]